LPFVMTDVSALGGVGHAAAASSLASIDRTARRSPCEPTWPLPRISADFRRPII
jgi:hypothetical protein